MSRVPFAKAGPRQASVPPGPGDRASSGSRPPLARKRSDSPGFFSIVGLAQPTLHIALSEEVLFLHPTPKDEPAQDPVLQGTVTLYLPKKRSLSNLTVRLVGRQDISWGDSRPYETGICLDKLVELFPGKNEVDLDKGEHKFAFSIIVPSSSASCERCPHGRVRHTVVAKAKGLGQLGGDVLSTEKPLFLIVNPGGAGATEPPPPLDHRFEGMLDSLGPYTMSLQSQHVMVGGLLSFRFHLVSPSANVMIYSIKVKINQHFTLISPSDPKKVSHPPTDVRTIFNLDGHHAPNFGVVTDPIPQDRLAAPVPRPGPLVITAPEEEYKIHHIARLPDDSVLRPSTHELTESAIRVRHDIAMEVTYRVMSKEEMVKGGSPKGKEKELKGKEKEKVPDRKKLVVSKPLTIFSCCCFVDSLTLPPYSFTDPTLEIDEADKAPPCLCGFKIGQVIRFHGQDLLREEGEQGITYAPLVKPESGPSTPPADTGRGRAPRLPSFFRTDSSDSLFVRSPTSPPVMSPPLRSPSSHSPSGAASTARNGYF